MAISFDTIPSALRIPIIAMEFDPSQARQGPVIQEYKALLIGNKVAAGSAVSGTAIKITSKSEAITQFGQDSVLHSMVEAFFDNNRFTELWCIPLDDNGAGVVAEGTITVATGTATAAGTIYLYIAGRRIPVAVAIGDDQDAVATAMAAAIQAYPATAQPNTSLPVSAAVDGVNANEVDLTALNKGEHGNDIDVRFNYNAGEAFPAGISCSVTTPMASGATNPVITPALTGMTDEQYNVIAIPWTDAANLALIETEMSDRWGPLEAIEGVAFAGADDTSADLTTLGESRNSPFVSIHGIEKQMNQPLEIAAMIAANVAYHGSIDPARPFQTLELIGAFPPAPGDRFTKEERNNLLFDGVAMSKTIAGGKQVIERLITTYKEDSLGNPDTSFLDVNTVLTLSYLRFDLRAHLSSRFPRHKLADDGKRYGPGQAIVTPSRVRAEIIAKARQWEELGLVENIDQFKEDLIVERSLTDPNRLDVFIAPDLVNQYRVTGIKAGFRV